MQRDAQWDALLERTRAVGRRLNIQDEDAVERLSDEFRIEKR